MGKTLAPGHRRARNRHRRFRPRRSGLPFKIVAHLSQMSARPSVPACHKFPAVQQARMLVAPRDHWLVPFKQTVCGLLGAVSPTTILAVSLLPLAAVGLKLGYRLQLAPGARLEPAKHWLGPEVTVKSV